MSGSTSALLGLGIGAGVVMGSAVVSAIPGGGVFLTAAGTVIAALAGVALVLRSTA